LVELFDHVETPAMPDPSAAEVIFTVTVDPPCVAAETEAAQELLSMSGYPASFPVDAAMPALARLRRHRQPVGRERGSGWSRWPERLVFWTSGGTWVVRAHVQAQAADRWRLRVAGPPGRPPIQHLPTTVEALCEPTTGAAEHQTSMSPGEELFLSADGAREPTSVGHDAAGQDKTSGAGPHTSEVTVASSPEDALAALAAEIRARQGAPHKAIAENGDDAVPKRRTVEAKQSADAPADLSRPLREVRTSAKASLPSDVSTSSRDVNDYEAPAAVVRGTHRLAANAPWSHVFGQGRDVAVLLGARGLSLVATAVERDEKFIVRRLVLTGRNGKKIVANVGARAVDHGYDSEVPRNVVSAARPVLLVVALAGETPEARSTQKIDAQRPDRRHDGGRDR